MALRQMRSLVERGLLSCTSKAVASGKVTAGAIENQVVFLVSIALHCFRVHANRPKLVLSAISFSIVRQV